MQELFILGLGVAVLNQKIYECLLFDWSKVPKNLSWSRSDSYCTLLGVSSLIVSLEQELLNGEETNKEQGLSEISDFWGGGVGNVTPPIPLELQEILSNG